MEFESKLQRAEFADEYVNRVLRPAATAQNGQGSSRSMAEQSREAMSNLFLFRSA
jgi:hypothetical protein